MIVEFWRCPLAQHLSLQRGAHGTGVSFTQQVFSRVRPGRAVGPSSRGPKASYRPHGWRIQLLARGAFARTAGYVPCPGLLRQGTGVRPRVGEELAPRAYREDKRRLNRIPSSKIWVCRVWSLARLASRGYGK